MELSYNAAQTARQAAKTKTTIQDNCALDVRNPPAPIGILPAPVDVQVVPSEHSGTADVAWKPVRGARAYTIERAADAPALDWGVIGTSTKKEASLNSMVSGTKYWFRVAAIGAAGQSAYSDPVPLFAP